MTIRSRILLGYAVMALLVVLTAASAALGFHQISGLVQTGLERYVVAREAADGALQALDAQHLATLEAVLGVRGSGDVGDLDEALALLRGVGNGGQEHPVDAAAESVQAYQRVAERLLAMPEGTRPEAYQRELRGAYRNARSAVATVVATSHTRLEDAQVRVKEAALQTGALLGACAAVGVLALVLLSHTLRRHVLDRLRTITAFVQAIEEGRHHERVELDGHDELARLGREMNRILDRHDEAEQRLKGDLRLGRQLLVGLAGAYGERVVLLSRGGDLVAHAGDLPDQPFIDALSRQVRDFGRRDELVESPWVGPGGESAALTSLRREQVVVGWLAVLA